MDKKLKTYYFLLNEKEYKKYKTLIKKRQKRKEKKRKDKKINVEIKCNENENPINKWCVLFHSPHHSHNINHEQIFFIP
jgi:hypothetical protein